MGEIALYALSLSLVFFSLLSFSELEVTACCAFGV